jgi:hypothetical protein
MSFIRSSKFVTAFCLSITASLLIAGWAMANVVQSNQSLRVFFVGNSLTDTINYKKFEQSVKAGGDSITWGRHTGPGATLDGLYKPNEKGELYGIAEEPYGKSPNALAKFQWDVITLQPFDRPLLNNEDGKEIGDVLNVRGFLKLMVEKNKDAQVYLHAHWPRRWAWNETAETAKPFDYSAHWDKPYSGGWEVYKDNSYEAREFYEKLMEEANKESPLSKPILIIPAGEVIYEFDKAAKAGKIPGMTSANDLYTDHIHFGDKGAYLTALTFYATIYQKPPTSISTKIYGFDNPEFEKIAQDIVWQVVSTYPHSGVSK